jgi:hypothetical protein
MGLQRISCTFDKLSNANAVKKSHKFSNKIFYFIGTITMSKLLIALLFSAFAMTTYAADTDNQTDGAELGTQETPQAQDQTKNSKKKASGNHSKKPSNMSKKAKHNHQKASGSQDNPLQPTESEPAPGAATN